MKAREIYEYNKLTWPEMNDAIEMEKFGWMEGGNDPWWSSRIRLFHPSQMPRPARRLLKQEVLECLAEGCSLRRALRKVDDPSQHAIFVELLREGRLDEGRRFEAEREGLLEWLVGAYGWARGEIEGWAARQAGSPIVGGAGSPQFKVIQGGPVTHMALKIVGLCALDFFELETGSHVWTSLGRGPEVVRVRVWPSPPGMAPAKVLVEHEEAQRAFEEAMATGREGVVNPSALLPVVRKIRFDPPRAEGGAAPLDIEDYGMAYAETVQAFTVDDALGPVWLLRMSREEGE